MCTHLTKRQSVYYFRRVIPTNLQPYFDYKKQWMHSLRTKDYAEGKRKARLAGIETDKLIDEATARLLSGSASTVPEGVIRGNEITEYQIERLEVETQAKLEQEARREGRKDLRDALEQRMMLGSQELQPWEAAIKDLFAERDYDTTVALEKLNAYKAKLAEALNSDNPAMLSEPAPVSVLPAVMLDTDIVEQWSVERQVRPKGIDAHRAVARWFYERTERKAVADITKADVLAFKNSLIAEGQTLANIKIKLSRLRTLLKYAADNDYAASNVAAGVTVIDKDAAKNKRTEFSIDALNAIFSSPVYTDGLRPTQGRGEAAYWLPLLALFTGARLEELGQLRTTDIVLQAYPDADGNEREAYFISIREDEAEGLKLKNAGSERMVPLHGELERLGFVEYCHGVKIQGHVRLFHELKPNVFGTLTAKWGEWFGKYKRDQCHVTDRRMTFHSFRHTFKQYARQVNMVEGIQRQLMGHAGDDAADDYGSGFYLHPLVESMAMFKIPGLNLPSPLKKGAG